MVNEKFLQNCGNLHTPTGDASQTLMNKTDCFYLPCLKLNVLRPLIIHVGVIFLGKGKNE